MINFIHAAFYSGEKTCEAEPTTVCFSNFKGTPVFFSDVLPMYLYVNMLYDKFFQYVLHSDKNNTGTTRFVGPTSRDCDET